MADDVSLVIEGTEYIGWESVDIERRIDAIASAFRLQMSYERFGDLPQIQIGASVEIRINGFLVITGVIDEITAQKGPESHSRVIVGRSLTRNIADCSVWLKTNQINDSNPFVIAQRIAQPLGVDVVNNAGALTAYPKFNWADGANAGQVIQDACRAQGLTARDDEQGRLVITRLREAVSRGDLVEGSRESDGNIESWVVRRSQANRFSNYYVKGRSSQLQGSAGNQVRGEATDTGVTPFRPLIIFAEGDIDNTLARRRAVHEAQRRTASDYMVALTVSGWRHARDGEPWRVDELVDVSIPSESVSGQLLVRALGFEKSNSGTRTRMELVPPAAYEAVPTATRTGTTQGVQRLTDEGFISDLSDGSFTVFDDPTSAIREGGDAESN